jgi:hypothetical protein
MMSDSNEASAQSVVMLLFAELQEWAGDLDEFDLIGDSTIACRAGDCCIRLHSDGWEYAENRQRHSTPLTAWQARRSA